MFVADNRTSGQWAGETLDLFKVEPNENEIFFIFTWALLAHSQLCHGFLALRMCELLVLVMLPLQRLLCHVTVRLRGMKTESMKTILTFASVSLKKIGALLLGSWWP